jgi:hypothetical protein
LAIGVVALGVAILACIYAQAAVQAATAEVSESRFLAELAKLSAEVTELADAYTSLMESHRKLRSRIGMRGLREQRKDVAVPDPATSKAELRAELAKAGKLNAKFHTT